MQDNKDGVLLFDVGGVYFCPACFRARAGPHEGEVVLEITLSTVISLGAVVDKPEFICSECGTVVAETPILQIENEIEARLALLENIPARCPLCDSDDILAEFEELGLQPIGVITLRLRGWQCVACSGAGRIKADITLDCRSF